MDDPQGTEENDFDERDGPPRTKADVLQIGPSASRYNSVAPNKHDVGDCAVEFSNVVDLVSVGPLRITVIEHHHARGQNARSTCQKQEDQSEEAKHGVHTPCGLPITKCIHLEARPDCNYRNEQAEEVVQMEHGIPAYLVISLRCQQGETEWEPQNETPDPMRLNMLDA